MEVKPCVILFAFCVALAPFSTQGLTVEQLKKTGGMIRNTCMGKAKLTNPELIDKFHQGEFVDDPTLKCYMKCVMGMLQAVKGNKLEVKLAKGVVDKMMPAEYKDEIKTAMDNCANSGDGVEDSCQIAFNFIHCLYDKIEHKEIIELFP